MRSDYFVFERRIEKFDKRNLKEKKEKKAQITWEENKKKKKFLQVIHKNKIINLGIMLKDYENGEEQKRYIDNNFSKHMAYIKVYSTNRGHLFNK